LQFSLFLSFFAHPHQPNIYTMAHCYVGHLIRPVRRCSVYHILVALAVAQCAIGPSWAFVPHEGGCVIRASPRGRPAAAAAPFKERWVRNAVEPSRDLRWNIRKSAEDRFDVPDVPDVPLGAHPMLPPLQPQQPTSSLRSFVALFVVQFVRIRAKIRSIAARIRSSTLVFALAVCLISVSSFGLSAHAGGSAGRAGGGSFGPAASGGGHGGGSSSRSYSRPNFNAPRSYSNHDRVPPQIRVYSGPSSYSHSPPIVIIDRSRLRTRWIAQPPPLRVFTTATPSSAGVVASPTTTAQSASTRDAVATRFSLSDVVLLTGAGSLITYGLYNNYRAAGGNKDVRQSALGPGATVARLVVVLNLPPGKHNALDEIRDLSERADTSTRRGVQYLVSSGTYSCTYSCCLLGGMLARAHQMVPLFPSLPTFSNPYLCSQHGAVALELLRRESSIGSAFTQSVHFPSPSQAEREFQRQSIRNRSKFERETCTFAPFD
jgi:uncharacterized membrane protein YgcG